MEIRVPKYYYGCKLVELQSYRKIDAIITVISCIRRISLEEKYKGIFLDSSDPKIYEITINEDSKIKEDLHFSEQGVRYLIDFSEYMFSRKFEGSIPFENMTLSKFSESF